LGPRIVSEELYHEQVEEVFNRVIFPLLDDLLKVEIFQRDPQGIPETRLRASALLCKAFMHLNVREETMKADFRILWIQILDLLDRLMNINKGDQLVRDALVHPFLTVHYSQHEAVPESLKNVVLVMNAVGILVPPSQGHDERSELQRTLWTATQERVERFLPGFLEDVIPHSTSASHIQ
jgi:brefeldin A-resistance guanine nucleotide exchange factor 1